MLLRDIRVEYRGQTAQERCERPMGRGARWAGSSDATQTVLRPPVVTLDGLVQPRIEPEIVLGFQEDLAPGASGDEIASAVGWVALGFEIVHCHFADWRMTPADAIADGGLHGALVVGERVRLQDAGAARLREVVVNLSRQNVVVEQGTGAAALGGPTDAINWLLRLPGVDGVRAGEIVTTGTLTSAHPVTAGETWRVDADGPVRLGHLELTFA